MPPFARWGTEVHSSHVVSEDTTGGQRPHYRLTRMKVPAPSLISSVNHLIGHAVAGLIGVEV